MKQIFLDNLDGGWSDAISDTYKDYNKIAYKFANIYAIIDPTTIQVKAYEDAYEETFLTLDKKFILRIFIMTGEYYNNKKLERGISSFGINLEDSESNELLSHINIASVYKRLVCDIDSDEEIEVDKNFVFDFIERACKCINKNNLHSIPEKDIEQLIKIFNMNVKES